MTAIALDGPEAALTTGLVPLILICAACLWVILVGAWRTPHDDRWTEPDLAEWRRGEQYARSIAAHPSNWPNPCRYCGAPADSRAGADVCLALPCLRQAVVDRARHLDNEGRAS